MASTTQTIEADLTWTGERFESGVQVRIRADGRIDAVGSLGGKPTLRLDGEALLPGLINAHSHAVLSELRGGGERFESPGSEAVSWARHVSAFSRELDLEAVGSIARRAFREMKRSGITSVGEFVDLDIPGVTDAELSRALLGAADEERIRITLLRGFRSGGSGDSRGSLQAYWKVADEIEPSLTSAQAIGAAVPDVLAASLDEIEELYAEATSRGMVFQIHVAGHESEVAACRERHGLTPLGMLNRRLELMSNFTAIHCTRSDPREIDRLLERGATICATPLSDAALGAGLQPRLAEGLARICVGTGIGIRIGMIEELRWLEYSHRLESGGRGIFRDGAGRVAPVLLGVATSAGALSLGLNAGRIAPGVAADFFTIDLGHPALAGASPDDLPERLVFSGHEGVIRRTAVDGNWASNQGQSVIG